MSKPITQRQHTVEGPGKETYVFKLEDKIGHSGVAIKDKGEAVMRVQEVRIFKVPGENNKIVVEIIKAV